MKWMSMWHYGKGLLWYKHRFAAWGIRTILVKPMQLDNPKKIVLGNRVMVAQGAWLMGSPDTETPSMLIGDGASVGHFFHCIAHHKVEIQQDVLIADKVFISDCTHRYEDISVPIKNQDIDLLNEVVIGEGTWIGENVCILGARVGKHCVIGSNAVVTKDIPDYCVAVGAPATVVKRYDTETKKWNSVE